MCVNQIQKMNAVSTFCLIKRYLGNSVEKLGESCVRISASH